MRDAATSRHVGKPADFQVWITAAGGFIGRNTARACAGRGASVAGLGHAVRALAPHEWGFSHWLTGEISASNLTQLCTATGAPAVVIHLAGSSTVAGATEQPREDFLRTVVSTMELFDWLRTESPETVVVAVSSAAVYGAGHPGPIAEGAAVGPASTYGHHKLMMESVCRSYGASYGIRSIVARLFSVYGSGLTKQLLWDACQQLQCGTRVLRLDGSGREVRDWVHVEDATAVLARLHETADSTARAVNVGTRVGTSVEQIATALCETWASGTDARAPVLEFSRTPRAGDPLSLVADVSMLNRIGHSCPREVVREIPAYVDWFRCNREVAA